MTTRVAAERIERGCTYEISPDWIKLPLILSNSEFIETVDSKSQSELTDLTNLVGDRFITRGHESVRFSDEEADSTKLPLINNGFQIINNFVGMLPETTIEKYQTDKKRRVFAQGGFKVLAVRGIRPITKDAPGLSSGGDALADVLDHYGLTVSEWEQLYEASINRLGLRMTGLRAGVIDEDVHATRHVYGVRVREEDLAFHISGVFNSLLFTMLQIMWFGRIRFTANDVVSNLQLKSLKKTPIPGEDPELAKLQKEIEQTYADVENDLEQRLRKISDLQEQREHRVCKLYGVLDNTSTPMAELLEEAKTWQTLFERILGITDEDTLLEAKRLADF